MATENLRGNKTDKGRVYRALERLDEFIETHPAPRLCGIAFAVVGGIVLIATAMQIYLDYGYRQEDRMARNWETATRPIGGNTGKGEALTFLIANGSDLTGIDLSCGRVGGVRMDLNGEKPDDRSICVRGAIIEGLLVPPGRTLQLWNLDGARLVGAHAPGSKFEDTELSTTFVSDSDLANSTVRGCFDRTQVARTNLMNARMALRGLYCGQPEDLALTIIKSDVSGLVIDNASGKQALSMHNYAWADMPPRKIKDADASRPEWLGGVSYCDTSARTDDKASVFAAFGTDEERTLRCSLSEGAARDLHPAAWAVADP